MATFVIKNKFIVHGSNFTSFIWSEKLIKMTGNATVSEISYKQIEVFNF